MKAAYAKTIPMPVKERAEFMKTLYYNLVRSVHRRVKQFEIMRQDDKSFTSGLQRLPEQALHLLI